MDEHILAVQRMQDYIAENLEREITLDDLARASLFSARHSYRLFQEYLGMTPAEYIRRLRLSKSAMRIKKEKKRVTDEAFDSGFDSVDGYTRAFSKAFGCKPGAYAKRPVPIRLFIPYDIKPLEHRKDRIDMAKTVMVQAVKKPEHKAIIKRGVKAEEYFAYCGEVGCDVWGLLMSMDSLCGEPVCLWLPEKYKKPNTSTYVQGVEVPADYDGPIPEGFDTILLPECEYLWFQGEPYEEDFGTAIGEVQGVMARYDPSILGYAWDDENPRIQLEPRGERGYIELRAVKKLAE